MNAREIRDQTDQDLTIERSRLLGRGRLLLGLFLYGQMFLQLILLMQVWPRITDNNWQTRLLWIKAPNLTAETALILAVALIGATGGSVHALGSFGLFVGQRRIVRSWVWWYLLRAPIGLALAVLFYFLIRGGLVVTPTNGPNAQGGTEAAQNGLAGVNIYGVGALAGLAGLCSEIATRKLREVFETLFRPAQELGDKAAGPSGPTLVSADPGSLASGTLDATIILRGTSFRATDEVLLNDTPLVEGVTWLDAERIRIVLTSDRTAAPGDLKFVVRREDTPGLASSELVVKVT